MNNPGKIRAWHSTIKEMFHFDSAVLIIDNPDRYGLFLPVREGKLAMSASGYKFMSSTGIMDQDSKIIMESDVVEAWDTHMGDDIKVWRRFAVLFYNGCFMFNGFNAHEFLNRFRGVKIIGNAHENPDMLDGVFARNASREMNKAHED